VIFIPSSPSLAFVYTLYSVYIYISLPSLSSPHSYHNDKFYFPFSFEYVIITFSYLPSYIIFLYRILLSFSFARNFSFAFSFLSYSLLSPQYFPFSSLLCSPCTVGFLSLQIFYIFVHLRPIFRFKCGNCTDPLSAPPPPRFVVLTLSCAFCPSIFIGKFVLLYWFFCCAAALFSRCIS
jgi:hypothetical protein